MGTHGSGHFHQLKSVKIYKGVTICLTGKVCLEDCFHMFNVRLYLG